MDDDLFRQFPTLQRSAADVISAAELRGKLRHGRPLRIKYGVDVTAPFLHIGHAVNLWAMRSCSKPGTR
jgi:tyrosyl-tRNA synthetase